MSTFWGAGRKQALFFIYPSAICIKEKCNPVTFALNQPQGNALSVHLHGTAARIVRKKIIRCTKLFVSVCLGLTKRWI